MNAPKDAQRAGTVVAVVSMCEMMAGGKGKFSSAHATFDAREPVGEVLKWAREHADRSSSEVVKVEVGYDTRNGPVTGS